MSNHPKIVSKIAGAAVALVITIMACISLPAWGQTMRYEETSSAASYTVGWTQGDASRSWSGGTAALSSTSGAQASFMFTGSSISWIGGRSPSTGIARVYLDGALASEVDTYSKTEEIRVPMFAVAGLTNTLHTLTIEVTGRKNAAAASPLVVVDAFDVPAEPISRIQETDPDVTLSAGWVQDNPVNTLVPGVAWTQGESLRSWSAGAAAFSTTPGAQATFSFTGTAVSWVGARGTQSGIASVLLDGVHMTDVDMYSANEQIQQEVYAVSGLADTRHTLTIQVTGRQNPASGSALVVVDGFDVTTSGTRHQDSDPAIAYGAGWIAGNRDKAYSEGASAESNVFGAQATFTFQGTGISWIGARGPQTGIAGISLDGSFVTNVDTYAPTEGPQHTDFSIQGLSAGSHTLTIQVAGRNPVATDAWVLIDAFDVVP